MWERQKRAIEGRITDGTLFPDIAIAADNDMRDLVNGTMHDLTDKLLEAVQLIRNDLELATANHVEAKEEARKSEEVRIRVAGRLEVLKGRYAAVLRDVKAVMEKKRETVGKKDSNINETKEA